MSTSDGRDGVQEILDRLPLLVALPEDARRLVMQSFEPVSFGFGSVIVEEGETGDSLFVLVSGSARALKRGHDGQEVSLQVLSAGDMFGEVALLDGRPRSATVRASSPVEALRLDKAAFLAAVDREPEIGERLEQQILRYRHRDLFRLSSAFSRIADETLDDLIDSLEPLHADKGEIVVRQGEASTCMYFVEDGRLRAVWQTEDGTRGDVAYLRRGDFFGERALLLGALRAVTIEAVTPASLLVLQEEDFRRLLERDAVFRDVVEGNIEKYEFKFAARVPLDFAEEVLPASASVSEAVGLDQVDEVQETREGAEPVADEWTGETREEKRGRIRRFPHVWQVDEMDCGAACLAMACRHFGRDVSLAHVRKTVQMGMDGTSLAGIAAGAESLGMRVRSVKASKSRLEELPPPAIVHFDGNHWVVLYAADGDRVRLSDPARGLVRMDRAEFEDKWSGYAALLAYDRARGGSDRRGQGRLDLGVLRTVQAHVDRGRRCWRSSLRASR